MRYGKRLFPYPTLNRESVLNQYVNSSFSFDYEVSNDDTDFILNQVSYQLTNEYINSLIEDNKATCLLIVDCSKTHYRHLWTLTKNPQKILIPANELDGKISISSVIMALEDIDSFTPTDLNSDYEGFNNFFIDKYDVIAIDDGYVEKINVDSDEGNLTESIFTIIGTKEELNSIMIVEDTSNKLVITLPEDSYRKFQKLANLPEYKWLVYSMVLVPALSEKMELIRRTHDNIDDAMLESGWFETIVAQYKNVYGEEFSNDVFVDLSVSSSGIAQKLLGCPTIQGIDSAFSLVCGNVGGNDDND